jgi:hypothetical protein
VIAIALRLIPTVGQLVGGNSVEDFTSPLMLAVETTLTLANECRPRRSVSEELRHSTAVFSGKAVAEEYRPIITPQPGWPEGGEILVIEFSVERWWRPGYWQSRVDR